MSAAPTHPMRGYLKGLGQRATRAFLTVARIMLPIMFVVYLASRAGLVRLAGEALAPAMSLLGLPADAGIIWATTILTGIYGGIAVVAALAGDLHVSAAQMSALGAMMMFAHNLPTEQAIVRRAGASAVLTAGLRLLAAVVYGAAVAWTCALAGWLQQPVSLTWMQGSAAGEVGPPDLPTWLLTTAQSMLAIWLIIIALILLLDVFERLGITGLLTRAMAPLLRLTGVEAHAAPLTTAGMLLGLTYGGALIIEGSGRHPYSRRTLLLALCWLSLFHGLIEDTLLIAALGANLWVIFVLRGLVTLVLMMALAALTRPQTRWGRRLAA